MIPSPARAKYLLQTHFGNSRAKVKRVKPLPAMQFWGLVILPANAVIVLLPSVRLAEAPVYPGSLLNKHVISLLKRFSSPFFLLPAWTVFKKAAAYSCRVLKSAVLKVALNNAA